MSNKRIGSVSLYFMRHTQAGLAAIGHLMRTPLTSLITLCVIGIAIALPGFLYLILQNAEKLTHDLTNTSQISIYLKAKTNASTAQQLLDEIQQQSNVESAKYISPNQGLQEFTQESSMNATIVESLSNNPIPGVILVKPSAHSWNPMLLNRLVNEFKAKPDVALVKVDMQWVQRLQTILELGKQGVFALTLLLSIGVLLITSNTIHLATQNRQRDIAVFRQVGATKAFIRRPFLYIGALYGTVGSIIAIILISSVFLWLSPTIDHLNQLYQSHLHLDGVSFDNVITLLLVGLLLGLFGAHLALTRHLKGTA